jgi:hypothetical protein
MSNCESPLITPAKCFQNFGWENYDELAKEYLQHKNGTMVATGITKDLLMFMEKPILDYIRTKAENAVEEAAEKAAEEARKEDLEKLTEMYFLDKKDPTVTQKDTKDLLMVMERSILEHIRMKAEVQ